MGVLAVNTKLRRTAGGALTVTRRWQRGARNAALAAVHNEMKDRNITQL